MVTEAQTGVLTVSKLVADFGALTAFFVVALAFMAYYLFWLYPQETKYRRAQDERNSEQLALSRLALETSNEVIRQNSAALEGNARSHERLGERLGCVEDVLERHDVRAEGIAQGIEVIKVKVGA